MRKLRYALAPLLIGASLILTAFQPATAGPAANQIAVLEDRVTALEFAVADLQATPTPTPTPTPAPTPTPTPTPVPDPPPFPGPVAPNVVSVPTSIDSTGATDVASALQSFVNSVPNGSTIRFQAGGTYRIGIGLLVSGRSNLIFDLNGATIRASDPSEAITNSPFYLNFPGTDIEIRNGTIEGSSPTPGVYGGGEHQHGVAIRGGARFTLTNLTISAVYGDGVYVAVGATDVWFHDSTVASSGRMGVAVISASRVLVESNEFTTVGYGLFDAEPNSGGVVTDVTFRNNHAQRISLAGANGFFFGGNATVTTGTRVENVLVQNNVIEEDALYVSVIMADQRSQNISIIGNTSNGPAKVGPVMTFSHVDGLTYYGNIQPLASGALTSVLDCTNVVTAAP